MSAGAGVGRAILRLFLLALALALGASGPVALASAPVVGAGIVPGLHSRTRVLDTQALAGDALKPASLAALLRRAGYLTGSEREFYGKSTTFTHVVARVLLFRRPQGATVYLGWLRAHASDVLGSSRREKPLPLGASPLLFSLVGCGCHGEYPTFLAAWRHGREVVWLLAAGPGNTRVRFTALARRVDAAAR